MQSQPPLREIVGPAGRLEALLEPPINPAGGEVPAAVVFGHPHPLHGGTMHTKVVYQSTKALARIGCAVLRFNFRGIGRSEGSWDNGVGELADFEAALDHMAAAYPGVDLWTAGMSFGAYVGLTAGATDDRVSALIGISTVWHMYDFGAVERSTKPKFFVHGERDEICPLKTMYEAYARLPEPKELVVIDGADHLFDGKASEVGDALADLLEDFHPLTPNP
jgi:uncharacterized protein